jgi:hypothetical protein
MYRIVGLTMIKAGYPELAPLPVKPNQGSQIGSNHSRFCSLTSQKTRKYIMFKLLCKYWVSNPLLSSHRQSRSLKANQG